MLKWMSFCASIESSRGNTHQVPALRSLLDNLQQAGFPSQVHRMDNEASTAIKTLLKHEYNITYQLAPPHIHRRNAAERAIRTFKDHVIAILGSALSAQNRLTTCGCYAGVASTDPLVLHQLSAPTRDVDRRFVRSACGQ